MPAGGQTVRKRERALGVKRRPPGGGPVGPTGPVRVKPRPTRQKIPVRGLGPFGLAPGVTNRFSARSRQPRPRRVPVPHSHPRIGTFAPRQQYHRPRYVAPNKPAAFFTPEEGRAYKRHTKADKRLLEQDIAIAIATAPIPLPLGKARLGARAGGLIARGLGVGGRQAARKAAEEAPAGLRGPLRVLARGRERPPVRKPPAKSVALRSHAPAPAGGVAASDKKVRRAATIPLQVGRAFVESPGKVGPKTAEQAAGLALAIPAGTIDLLIHPSHAKHLPKALAKDLSRRYGPYVRGEQSGAQFRKRIRKEGAAAELLDLFTVGTVGGATVGRAAGAAAREGALGPGLRRLATEPRPRLREAGGVSREQQVAPNLFRAAGQRGEDIARRRAQARRERRGLQRTTAEGRTRGFDALAPGPGEVVKLTARGRAKAQRHVASAQQSRAFIRLRSRQFREIRKGAEKALASLGPKQRKSAFHVIQGLVKADDPAAAVRMLERRRAQIKKQAIAGAKRPTPLLRRRTNEELRTIDYLIRHADEVFTPELEAFRRVEHERSRMVEAINPAVRTSTAEVRRHRPQGELLGISHPYDQALAEVDSAFRSQLARKNFGHDPEVDIAAAKLRKNEMLQELEAHKPRMDREYLAAVRQAAAKEGLPEPAYVQHFRRPGARRSDLAPGSGERAIAGPKRSRMILFRQGRADISPQAYLNTLARQIKYGVQWEHVDRSVRNLSLPHPGEAEMKRVLGYAKPEGKLSMEEWRDLLDARGINPDSYGFVMPGRMRKTMDEGGQFSEADFLESAEAPESQILGRALDEGTVDSAKAKAALESSEGFVRTPGAFPVPNDALRELRSASQPSGKFGRVVTKAQGFTSRILLATSPAWEPFQIASNAFLTGFGTHGKVWSFPASIRYFKSLPKSERDHVGEYLGEGGALRGHGERMYLGATANGRFVNAWRAFARTPFVKKAQRYNPLDLVFMADDAQTNFFKRTLLYDQAKREAYRDLNRHVGLAQGTAHRLVGIFTGPPEKQMRAILQNPEKLERHARAVNDMLGDWTRYTSNERRYLKRGIMFYGFLRFSTHLAFYTMPVGHPLMASIMGQLGKLHTEEVKDLVGGDEAPWAYSRIFFGPKNKLKSIDVLRLNPFSNVGVSTVQDPRALTGLVSPLGASIMDQVANKNIYRGTPLRAGPGTEELRGGILRPARWEIMLDDLLSLHGGYRLGEALTQKGTQADTSLLFRPRSIHYKSAEAKKEERARRRNEGTAKQEAERFLAPQFFPRPDTTRQTIKKIRKKKGGAKKDRRKQPLSPFGRSGTPTSPFSGGGTKLTPF